jgi:hypothetical protein
MAHIVLRISHVPYTHHQAREPTRPHLLLLQLLLPDLQGLLRRRQLALAGWRWCGGDGSSSVVVWFIIVSGDWIDHGGIVL